MFETFLKWQFDKKTRIQQRKLIQLFNQIVVNMVVWYETWEVKMCGLYCVRRQKKQVEIQAEAQAKTQVSKAEKTGAHPVRRKERNQIKANNSKSSETLLQ